LEKQPPHEKSDKETRCDGGEHDAGPEVLSFLLRALQLCHLLQSISGGDPFIPRLIRVKVDYFTVGGVSKL